MTEVSAAVPHRSRDSHSADRPRDGGYAALRIVQTRYLILAALLTGLAILAAAAVWFARL